MEKINFIRLLVISLFLLFIVLEMLWSYKKNKEIYGVKDTLTNIGVFIGLKISRLIFFSFQITLISFMGKYSLFTFEKNTFVFSITFFLVDFTYYWYHRFSHTVKFLWAFHVIHHSSPFMNLTVAYRLNWLNGILTPIIFAPIVLIGFPVEFIFFSFAFNLLYQFFLHTEAVRTLGFLEGTLATPSAHRVHHGSNDKYIDKNFGGFLMIWDRLFGTYQKESETPKYGITKGFISNNPIVLNFHGFIDYFKGHINYKG